MPQIWLTYDEFAAQLDCSPQDARAHVIGEGWDRRKSRDGLTRVKLQPAAAIEYMRAAIRELDAVAADTIDEQVSRLRAASNMMKGREAAWPHRMAA